MKTDRIEPPWLDPVSGVTLWVDIVQPTAAEGQQVLADTFHLSAISNRLNQVMKVLTVMSTIFLPLTVLTGMWGMNVPIPAMPGAEHAQFWWLVGIMVAISAAMLALFHRKGWI
jgi:Mg2+ and Co2+ transporter CorA